MWCGRWGHVLDTCTERIARERANNSNHGEASVPWGSNVGSSARVRSGPASRGIGPVVGQEGSVTDRVMASSSGGHPDRIEGVYMTCLVEGVKCAALVDTGANRNFVSQEWLKQASIQTVIRPCDRGTRSCVMFANGQQAQNLGMVTLGVRAGQGCFHADFMVLTGLVDDVTLGVEFLVGNEAVIDVPQMRCTLQGVPVDIRVHAAEPRLCQVVVRSRMVVPAQSEVCVPVQMECGFERNLGAVGLVEDWVGNERLRVARSIQCPREQLFVVRVANFEDEEVELHPGSTIAMYTPLEGRDVLPWGGDRRPARGTGAMFKSSRTARSPEVPISFGDSEANPRDRERLIQLVGQYRDIFAVTEEEIGEGTRLVELAIETNGARPVKQPARRLAPNLREQVNVHVDEWLQRGVIRESQSPWSSPLVVVKKKDAGTLRVCVDMRAVNEATVTDAMPLPRADECLEAMAGARMFTSLDARSGYHQIPIVEADRHKTAFSVPFRGQFEWTKVPFGLKNGPAIYARLMAMVLDGLQWEICLSYVDDIAVWSNDAEEHLERLTLVFERLRVAGIKLKPQKCTFMAKTLKFLGHVVSNQGIAKDADKVRVVREWPAPKTVKQLQSFLGFVNYYNKFLSDFSVVAFPLHELLKKDHQWVWTGV